MSGLAPAAPAVRPVALAEAVTALAWTRQALVVASADGRLSWLDPQSGRISRTVTAHDGPVTRLVPDPRGETLASAGEDGRVRLWPATGGLAIATRLEIEDWVEHLTWSRQGDWLAAAAGRRLWLWDRAGRLVRDAGPFPATLTALAWSPAADQLLAGGYRCLQLLPCGNGSPLQRLEPAHAISACRWSPDGKAFAVGLQDKCLEVWRRNSRQPGLRRFLMRGYTGKVSALAWRVDGRLLASAGGRDIVLWANDKTRLGGSAPTVYREHGETVTRLAFRPRGDTLAAADRSGRLLLWSGAGQWQEVLSARCELTALSWHPDGGLLAVGGEDGLLYLLR